eukprot:scaffold14044_cov52-Phaeocystis_antarctica.AAC.4
MTARTAAMTSCGAGIACAARVWRRVTRAPHYPPPGRAGRRTWSWRCAAPQCRQRRARRLARRRRPRRRARFR